MRASFKEPFFFITIQPPLTLFSKDQFWFYTFLCTYYFKIENNGRVDLVRVTKEEELDEIYALTYESYLRAGLIEVKEDTRVIHHPHFDRCDQTYIIAAKKEGKSIGTISITLDSKRGVTCR
ncbi:N-acyl amino acid synthase FeeM domain-containing protein [Lishizhenia sp.]|uniref:N-acyl amino acid synthase FeeM domain-containing protein n=1 Tax=Lishizhenia sp. TaxID=2497594 RepID=UPI00299F053B|nr:hypothetical protein [Lishizhenia sp.]MDX1447405.1 hypothetical protein [Lishizhenia sp.]